MRPGEQYVMMLGMIWMPLWFAQVLATQDSVRYIPISKINITNIVKQA